MAYHDEVTLDMFFAIDAAKDADEPITAAAIRAIPDNTAKIDGRFVKLEPFGAQPRSAPDPRYYRIAENQQSRAFDA